MSGRPVALALVVSLALAACGGAAATSGPATQAPPAPSADATSAPGADAGALSVAIIDNAFQASDITVAVGTTVTWTNRGQRGHTVTSKDGTFGSNGTLQSGATYEHVFSTAGTFAYFCAIHSSIMKGTITVTP